MEVIHPGNRPNPTLKPMYDLQSSEQLLADWKSDVITDTHLRNSIVKEMEKRGLRPDTRNHNIQTGLYPDIDDPDFASRLFRKTEFMELASSSVPEDTCTKSRETFETTAVQRLVARFLHPSTPYKGILLDHGVGVGKTCSAITVAETFLDVLPNNTVYIIVPQAIADGFRSTIFDVGRLVPASNEYFERTGERWTSNQCTGMTYLRLTGMEASESREEIAKEAEKEIKTRYKIMGYLAFANWVNSKLAAIPKTLTDVRRVDAEHKIIMGLFSDHLIIIDEAHNLRDSREDETDTSDEPDDAKQTDAIEGKQLTPVINKIIRVAEGLRLMLMTATPMYNTAPEIIFLLNLLAVNDTKDESARIKSEDVFIPKDNSFTPDGEKILTRLIKRYVSYMRGENPNTFPLRLTNEQALRENRTFLDAYPTISASKTENIVKMTPTDKKIMEHLPFLIHQANPSSVMGKALDNALKRRDEDADEAQEVTNLDGKIQLGNFVYPDGSYGDTGITTFFKSSTETIKGTKCTQYAWNTKNTDKIESIFKGSGLQNHSPKVARIVDSITSAKGISFVYSRYMKSGALPLAIALECAGWCRVLADGTPAPLLKQDKKQYTNYYILLTSDKGLSPNFKGLLKYATTFQSLEEAEGSKVKAIIGSQIASEGLDLKCIREIHLLDGWYHLNRIEQITGRGIRFCSHTQLPLEKRNCLIYLHVLTIPKYETADLYMYRIAIRKAQPIGRVSRLLKIHAWDCMLNIQAIQLRDLPTRRIEDSQGNIIEEYDLHDKPYTSFCDFSDTCEYICGSKPLPDSKPNSSTYKEYNFRRKFLEKQDVLAGIFSTDVEQSLADIKQMYDKDMPWSMGAIGLREALGSLRIKRKDGIMGTLILRNGYVLFQPDRVTDYMIPMALRYGRAYGHIPRTIVPERQILLSSEMPLRVQEEPMALDTKASVDSAIASVQSWIALYDRIVAEPLGFIPPPKIMSKETFHGWRWIFYHFRALAETKPIAIRWWMDNVWTSAERSAVLAKWTSNTFGPDEREWMKLFMPNELFTSADLNGYLVFDTETATLQKYCMTGGSLAICTSLLATEVDKLIPAPTDRKTDTGSVFGFLTTKKKTVVFKTVDKNIENIRWEGAECQNTSNLKNHRDRIRAIQALVPQDKAIKALFLDDDEDTMPSKDVVASRKAEVDNRYKAKGKMDPTLNIVHVGDLSQKQICPYMEFILRWLDMARLLDKRWFLSLVDSARAGVKME